MLFILLGRMFYFTLLFLGFVRTRAVPREYRQQLSWHFMLCVFMQKTHLWCDSSSDVYETSMIDFRMFYMLVIILVKQWPTCMKELGEFKEWNSYCHYTCSLIVIESLQTSVFFYYRCISFVYDYHFYFVTVTLNLCRLLLCVLMAFGFEYWLLADDTDTYLEQWLALSVLHVFTFCCPSWQGNLLIFPCSLCLLR